MGDGRGPQESQQPPSVIERVVFSFSLAVVHKDAAPAGTRFDGTAATGSGEAADRRVIGERKRDEARRQTCGFQLTPSAHKPANSLENVGIEVWRLSSWRFVFMTLMIC